MENKSPRTLNRAISKLKFFLKREKNKRHCLQQQKYRREKAKMSLKTLVRELAAKKLISENAEKHIRKVCKTVNSKLTLPYIISSYYIGYRKFRR